MRSALLVLTLALGPALLGEDPPKAHSIDVGAGRIAWFDITSTNLAKSKEFYSKLFGWTFTGVKGANDLAFEIVSGGTQIGTVRQAEGKIGSFNGVVYVQVDDIEASCKKATELGATLVPGFPFDLDDDRGSIGLIADPVGHPIGMYSHKMIKPKPAK